MRVDATGRANRGRKKMASRRQCTCTAVQVLLQLAVLSVLAACVAPKSWGTANKRHPDGHSDSAGGKRKATQRDRQASKAKQANQASKAKQAAGKVGD